MSKESKKNKISRISEIVRRLKDEYPYSKCSLTFRSPFQLLVATILSAQCTDERVNKVTGKIFPKHSNAKAFASLSEILLPQIIKCIVKKMVLYFLDQVVTVRLSKI